MLDIMNIIINADNSFLTVVKRPPNSLWFIILVSIAVSIFSTLLNKLLVDQDQIDRQQDVIKKHKKEKESLWELSESGNNKDKRAYERKYKQYMRRDASIQKMQRSMSMTRLKPTCANFIPMIVFFYVIRNMFTAEFGVQFPVGKLVMNPLNPDNHFPSMITGILRSEWYSVIRNINVDGGWAGFSGFYFLCSIALSAMVRKAFGMSTPSPMGDKGGMGKMFDTKGQMDLPRPGTL